MKSVLGALMGTTKVRGPDVTPCPVTPLVNWLPVPVTRVVLT